MRRKHLCRALLLALLAVVPTYTGAAPLAAAAGKVTLERWTQATGADFAAGTFAGTEVVTATGDGAVRLQSGSTWGTYTSPTWEPPIDCLAAGLLYEGQTPRGSALSFQVRVQDQAGDWGDPVAVPIGAWSDPAGLRGSETLVEFPGAIRGLQYQVTFSSAAASPVLETVVVVCLGGERSPTVKALAPWQEPDGQPRPVGADRWGSAVEPAAAGTAPVTTTQAIIVPASWSTAGVNEAGRSLRMLQHYQRQVLAWDDLLYTFLVDPQGRIYRGRAQGTGETLYIGLLGAHPHEAVTPTAEDALVALFEWWTRSLSIDRAGVALLAPTDPGLAERIVARCQVGDLRRNEWFLARGLDSSTTDEWILYLNPDDQRTLVTTELYRQGTRIARRAVRVPAVSRYSILADTLVTPGPIWARVSAEGSVLVERAIYYGHDGDDSAGLEGLSSAWYLPGGSQDVGFTTTLVLLNPGPAPITATVTVFSPGGPVGEKAVALGPRDRLDLPVGDLYTGTTPVGCRVMATGPIAVEQEVRFAAGQAGYGMPGTPLLARQWTFAGVQTEESALTVLALLNPYTAPVTISLTLMSEDGTMLRRPYTVLPGEQRLNLNMLLPDLALAAEVQAGRPIAAARLTYFNALQSAEATLGAVRSARRWYLPEGSTDDPFESLVLVANPNDVPTALVLSLMGGAGELGRFEMSMPAHSRMTVSLNGLLPGVSAVSTAVEADWPVVVERSMYLHDRQGGHACLGIAR